MPLLVRTPKVIAVESLSEGTERFDTVIDVRSPSEFAEDRIPGAINRPVLDDHERAEIGTQYVQASPFEARRRGAALVAKNVARHLECDFSTMPSTWKPLIYCWRGGARSGSMAHILAQVGWRVSVLDGGYRSFRRSVVSDLAHRSNEFSFVVICGETGSGKTELLSLLAAEGAQVLDLEHIARHRGSLLGVLPDEAQPSQKWFESQLHAALFAFDRTRPIFVESESTRIGNVRVPPALRERIAGSVCVRLNMALHDRVELLLGEYAHHIADPQRLERQLDPLCALHSRSVIDAWKNLIRNERWHEFVAELLTQHYDPAYLRSMQKNFLRLKEAKQFEVSLSGESTSLTSVARQLAAAQW